MKNILQHFNKIKDNRSNQGKRYQLNSILTLVSIGYMVGCDSLLKIHIFGQRMTKTNRQRLGFTNSMPSHPTITQTLKRIDPEEFEAVLSQLVTCQLDQNFIQIAIDGKSIRSTSDSTKGLLHLVSAFAPEVGAVLIQSKSGLGGGEIATAEKLITNLDIKNKVITGDALYAQEVLSNKIVSRSGDYVFKVKRNKKKIIDDIKQGFEHYSQNNLEIDSYEYTVKGHGRIESRKIEAIESHRKYFGGWAMSTIKQAAIITSKTFNIRKQTERIETHFVISSLERSKASAKDLLDFIGFLREKS